VSGRVRRNSALEALIFDVDGTLADTEEAHRQAFNEAFRAHGLEFRWDVERYAELLAVTGGKERLRHYMEGAALPERDLERLLERVPQIHATKTRLYGELVDAGRVCVRPGIQRLLGEARQSGVRLAVASTTSPENVERLIVAGFGAQALGWFDVIATGDAVARKKPAPDVYEHALGELDLTPDRAVAFEDSVIGVRAAKAAHLFTVATPTTWTLAQDFGAADLTLPSLQDLGLEQLSALLLTINRERTHAQAD
jgi:HAD superfamily hydrolase (TIGR01509 family)